MHNNIRHISLIIILGSIIFGIYFISATTSNGIVVPLDDAYIHFQYAKQASTGQIWQYNNSDAPSSGATSFLYPFLVSIGFIANFSHSNVVAGVLVFGGLLFIASSLLVFTTTDKLLLITSDASTTTRKNWGVYISALFLLTGANQFGFFNGMETGLFAILLLAAFTALLNERYFLCCFFLVTSSLVRPEGIFLTLVYLFAFVSVNLIRHKKQMFRTLVKLGLISIFALIPYGVNYLITGSIIATGASAKSWLGNVPFRPFDIAISILNGFATILFRLTIASFAQPAWWIPLGMLPLTMIGCYLLGKKKEHLLLMTTSGSIAIGIALSATLITAVWHFGRYQVPYLVMMFPIAGIGLYAFHEFVQKFSPTVSKLILVGFSAYAILGTAESLSIYRQAVYSVAQQQIVIGRWIDANLDETAIVAVHDVGAIRFFGNRTTLDMIGLTSQGYAPLWREGMGAVYEKMESSDNQPSHFATYPNAFSLSYLNGTDMFAEKLFQAEVSNWSSISSAESVQVVYRANWDKADSGNELQQYDVSTVVQDRRQIGRIDVANIESERSYDLIWWESDEPIGFSTTLNQFSYLAPAKSEVIDGGRLLTGGIEFSIESELGQSLLLAVRIHNLQPNHLNVAVNGQQITTWPLAPAAGNWLESYIVIDSNVVKQGNNRISLTVANPSNYIELYHLWVFDYTEDENVLQPSVPMQVRFVEGIDLLGYSIERSKVKEGEKIELELLWTIIGDTDIDAKVFVHVYSKEGDLVAQSDNYPVYGTRPPYTWNWITGETISDKHTILLDSEAMVGTYQIAVGLYDPNTGERLPLVQQAECQLDEMRACLTEIEVVH